MNIDTKDQIIQTVLQMIGQEGTQKLTIREIAKQANVNIAAINYHFGSKDNVIKQAMDVYTKTMGSTFVIFDESDGNPIEKLHAFLKKFAEISMLYPGITKSFVSQMMYAEAADPLALQAQKHGVAKFVQVLKEATAIEEEIQLKYLGLQMMSTILYPVLISNRLPDLYEFDYREEFARNEYIDLLLKKFIPNA